MFQDEDAIETQQVAALDGDEDVADSGVPADEKILCDGRPLGERVVTLLTASCSGCATSGTLNPLWPAVSVLPLLRAALEEGLL
jgi:hypothetical protein